MSQDLTKGFAELSQELSEISRNISEPARRAALDAGADIIVDRARVSAPVRTGLLKSEGIDKGDNNGYSIRVGWTEGGHYGWYLEYGTSKMAPRPHLRPAYEQGQNQIFETMLGKLKLK